MKTIKRKLILKAKKKCGRIYPIGQRKCLSHCFVIENGVVYFWYEITVKGLRTSAVEKANI